ncbi:hypothetical protein VTI74DRAFT_1073 [Chaetomium olivicolor]
MGEPLTGTEHVVLRLESPRWPANESDGWGKGNDGTKISIASSHTRSFLTTIPKPDEEYLKAQERQWTRYQTLLAENQGTPSKALFQDFEVAFNHKLAAIWETNCSDYHDSCSRVRLQGASWLPYRLIDVLTGTPFLVETGDPAFEKAEYVALSYCWGNGARFMTLRENVKEYQSAIPYEELPATFKDAMWVTGYLGYRYLWIDALCIVQDDAADLGREIVRMDKIYQNAVVTIAAQGATGVGDGLFNATMHPLARMACKISFKATLSKPDKHGSGTATFVLDSSQEPPNYLSGRGWVLQESVLAPRALILGAQMRWRCVQEDLTEIRPVPLEWYSVPVNSASGEMNELWIQPVRRLLYETEHTLAGSGTGYVFEAWRMMLIDYTRRNLTFRQDVLRALVGLSKAVSSTLDLTYLAGLWRENLLGDLSWFVDWEIEWTVATGREARRLPGEMRVQDPQALTEIRKKTPSWSWAAAGKAAINHTERPSFWTASPLDVDHGPKRPDILDAFCLSEDPINTIVPPPPGRTRPWAIVLSAPLRKAVLKYPAKVPVNDRFHTLEIGYKSKTLLLARNSHGTRYAPGCATLDCPLEVAMFGDQPALRKKDPKRKTVEMDVFCMPLQAYQYKNEAVSHVVSLILVEHEQRTGPGLYSRIGLGVLPVECWDGREEMVKCEII